jgi:integral membrane protein (TIGR01906 family)
MREVSLTGPASPWPSMAASLLRGLVAVALPLFLLAWNIRYVAFSLPFYEAEFAKYRIAERWGFTQEELIAASQALIAYFQGPQEEFSYRRADGREIYNEREVAHLRDVKVLLQLVGRTQTASGALELAGLLGLAWLFRAQRPLVVLGGALLTGALVTMALLAGLGVLAFADFSAAFLQFHYLAFRNALWQLDPAQDNLIRMFPEGFFFDAALTIALATLVQAVGVMGLGLLLRWAGRRLG